MLDFNPMAMTSDVQESEKTNPVWETVANPLMPLSVLRYIYYSNKVNVIHSIFAKHLQNHVAM
jgi:hypothetical protein